MEVRNCPRCGKVFTAITQNICPECIKKEEELFDNLKKFMEDNPGCNMAQIVEGTGISAKRIMRYIREGRLEITKGMQGELTCESCHKPITRGRFCDACAVKINNNMTELFKDNKAKQNTGAKMHTTLRNFK